MSDILDLRYLMQLAAETLRSPREGAREILRIAPPMPAPWLCFGLVMVGSLIFGELASLMITDIEPGPLTNRASIVLGLIQAGLLFLMVHAIAFIGRGFGGTGDFEGALILVTWLQFIFLLVQAVQLVLLVTVPLLGALVTLIAVGLFFWLLVNFIAELHGFENLGMVFLGTLGSFFALVFALAMVLGLLGIGLTSEASAT